MARPTTTTSRPHSRAASATERMRATFDAKVVIGDAVRRILDELGEVARHVGLARADAVAHDVGGIADERQHALVAERPEVLLRRQAAEIGRVVELPVARMDDEAVRRADRERVRFRNRMGDRARTRCRTGRASSALPGRDLVEVDLRRAGLGQAAGLEKADGEPGRVDRRAQARPHLDERADMVLVRMGDEDAEQVLALLLDEAQVRIDEVDAGQMLLAAEAHAAIDQDPLPARVRPEAVERGVHADLAEAAEGNEDQFVLGMPSDRDLVAPAPGSAVSCCKLGK